MSKKPEEKTSDIEKKRHSLAHLLAAAVVELYPNAKPTIGPAIENGFYYDFDFSADKRGQDADKSGLNAPSNKDLLKIEKKMREILKTWKTFDEVEMSEKEAKEFFAGNPYKLELIEEIAKDGKPITFYKSGEFQDLCRGGHVESARDIKPDSFKLQKIAGAYWRGDEKNKMLTRIYGLAFDTKEELEAYRKQLEEAEKRDHRKIGQEQDLFTFSPLVGPGLPLWTARGTIIREELNDFVSELRKEKGYEKVTIPHITKRDLYEKSGHWQKFADELMKIKTREGKEYALKPMNCPHHTQIYAHLQRSYRDLPQRYAETTMVYRDEQSGELGGLTRVLSITQDDAHVFCRHSQIREEFDAIWDIINKFYGTFGFKMRVRLSFHDPEHFEKYLGTKEIWANAEKTLKSIAEAKKTDYFIGVGEAAMYGPKLDFMAKDSLGREHQVATVQLDMNLPERFDLFCVNEKSEHERIAMLHCAIMGSIERFSAVLIEHLAGIFPTWLAPVQVAVVPVRENHNKYAQKIADELKAANIRVEFDSSNEGMGKKVRQAKNMKIPYILVLGDKEVESKKVTVESRDKGNLGQETLDKFLKKLEQEIKERI